MFSDYSKQIKKLRGVIVKPQSVSDIGENEICKAVA